MLVRCEVLAVASDLLESACSTSHRSFIVGPTKIFLVPSHSSSCLWLGP